MALALALAFRARAGTAKPGALARRQASSGASRAEGGLRAWGWAGGVTRPLALALALTLALTLTLTLALALALALTLTLALALALSPSSGDLASFGFAYPTPQRVRAG